MCSRRVHPPQAGAVEIGGGQSGGHGRIVEVQRRRQAAEVVEDVESGPGLDHCEGRDDGAAEHECTDQGVQLRAAAHHADDDVEEQEEAQPERQRLDDCAGDAQFRDPSAVDPHGCQRGNSEQDHRRLEAAPAEADAGVDQERRQPGGRDERDQDAVRLETERQRRRQQAVALDRDEEDHRDDGGQETLPRQQNLVREAEEQEHQHERRHHGRTRVDHQVERERRHRGRRQCAGDDRAWTEAPVQDAHQLCA